METWTNLRKMMRYWWTPSSPPPSAIWKHWSTFCPGKALSKGMVPGREASSSSGRVCRGARWPGKKGNRWGLAHAGSRHPHFRESCYAYLMFKNGTILTTIISTTSIHIKKATTATINAKQNIYLIFACYI